jgi:hypothetical protein
MPASPMFFAQTSLAELHAIKSIGSNSIYAQSSLSVEALERDENKAKRKKNN